MAGLPVGIKNAGAAYDDLVAMRKDIVRMTTELRLAAQQGDGKPTLYIGYINFLTKLGPRWSAISEVPGMAAYVASREPDVDDVVASYIDVYAAGAAAVLWLEANLLGHGNYLSQWEKVSGEWVAIEYSAGQAQNLLPLLDDIIMAVG